MTILLGQIPCRCSLSQKPQGLVPIRLLTLVRYSGRQGYEPALSVRKCRKTLPFRSQNSPFSLDLLSQIHGALVGRRGYVKGIILRLLLCLRRDFVYSANVRIAGLPVIRENIEFVLFYSRVDVRPNLNVFTAVDSTAIE
jgi:hypothetical protein